MLNLFNSFFMVVIFSECEWKCLVVVDNYILICFELKDIKVIYSIGDFIYGFN